MLEVKLFESRRAYHALFVGQVVVLMLWHLWHGQVMVLWSLTWPWAVVSAISFFVGGVVVEPLHRWLGGYWPAGVFFAAVTLGGLAVWP